MLTFAEIALSFRNESDGRNVPGIDRVWAYLAARGVTKQVAADAGLHIMQAVELIAAARRSPNVHAADGRAAIVFPHYKLGNRTQPLEWWSARLVPLTDKAELRVVASFGDLLDPATTRARAPGKMFCPPNEPPRAYMPPVYDWTRLRDGQRVYIHESALKALNGAILGTASVGLNGVWGWSSRKHGVALVEELRDLPWRALKLQPVIVFDSNAHDNWQVQAAEGALAAKLVEITGRQAVALRVPKGPGGENQGFDDFRQRVGDASAAEWLTNPGTDIDISDYRRMMLQLSAEVCVVRDLGRVADQRTGALMTRSVFTDVNYAHFTFEQEDGERLRQVNVPKLWLASGDRVEVQRLEYAPGKPRLVQSGAGGGIPNLNLWRGMGCDPDPGDIDPWLDLLANNVNDDDLRQWIIAWCAYPLQNPGAKILSYPLIFGPSGTGKNLLFKPLHTIYGDNAVLISREQLRSQFNSVYAMKQFVHVDEIHSRAGDRDDVAQKVKLLISSDRLVVNAKGQPEYELNNVANFAITDNFWDCLKLDQDDRRACVIRWTGWGCDRRGDQAYWARYVRWAEQGGAHALYDYLLNFDCRWFDPAAWAPATTWKEEVKAATMGPMEQWVKDLWEHPQDVLPLVSMDRAVWTAKELSVLYYAESEADLSPGKVKAMANALRNGGFQQAHGGGLVKRPGTDKPERFWVVQQRGGVWDGRAVIAHLKRMGG